VLAKTNIELNKLQNCTDDEQRTGAFFFFWIYQDLHFHQCQCKCQAIVAIVVAIVKATQPFVYHIFRRESDAEEAIKEPKEIKNVYVGGLLSGIFM